MVLAYAGVGKWRWGGGVLEKEKGESVAKDPLGGVSERKKGTTITGVSIITMRSSPVIPAGLMIKRNLTQTEMEKRR